MPFTPTHLITAYHFASLIDNDNIITVIFNIVLLLLTVSIIITACNHKTLDKDFIEATYVYFNLISVSVFLFVVINDIIFYSIMYISSHITFLLVCLLVISISLICSFDTPELILAVCSPLIVTFYVFMAQVVYFLILSQIHCGPSNMIPHDCIQELISL